MSEQPHWAPPAYAQFLPAGWQWAFTASHDFMRAYTMRDGQRVATKLYRVDDVNWRKLRAEVRDLSA